MSYLQSTKFTNFCGHPHSIPRGGVQGTYHMGGRPADLAGQEEAQGSGLHVTGWPASQPHVWQPLSQRKQPGNCKWEAGMGGFAQQQKAGAGSRILPFPKTRLSRPLCFGEQAPELLSDRLQHFPKNHTLGFRFFLRSFICWSHSFLSDKLYICCCFHFFYSCKSLALKELSLVFVLA